MWMVKMEHTLIALELNILQKKKNGKNFDRLRNEQIKKKKKKK